MRAQRQGSWGVALCWVLLSGTGCGGVNLFSGRINGAFFEPTGTIFGFVDALSRTPELKPNVDSRLVVNAVYAYFDPALDVSSTSGSNLGELKEEIAQHDWFSLEWAKEGDLQNGSTYKAVLLRTTLDPIFRTPDPSSTDGTTGFTAHVGFRRAPVRRNAPYKCPSLTPAFVCQSYKPFGSRARVEVRANSANKAVNGQLKLSVTVKVEQIPTDPTDALTGTLQGNITAQMVSERVAEANMDTLELYSLFNVAR